VETEKAHGVRLLGPRPSKRLHRSISLIRSRVSALQTINVNAGLWKITSSPSLLASSALFEEQPSHATSHCTCVSSATVAKELNVLKHLLRLAFEEWEFSPQIRSPEAYDRRNHRPSSLEPIQSLRCNDSLDVWASCKAETEKLPLLRSCHGTLGLIYLELKFVRDESRNALHHPPTCPLAVHVDIAIIRETNVAMPAAL